MLVYEYVCFCCMIEDKCICVCLIPALISFDYVSWAVCPAVLAVLVASSSPVEGWGRDTPTGEEDAINFCYLLEKLAP